MFLLAAGIRSHYDLEALSYLMDQVIQEVNQPNLISIFAATP